MYTNIYNNFTLFIRLIIQKKIRFFNYYLILHFICLFATYRFHPISQVGSKKFLYISVPLVTILQYFCLYFTYFLVIKNIYYHHISSCFWVLCYLSLVFIWDKLCKYNVNNIFFIISPPTWTLFHVTSHDGTNLQAYIDFIINEINITFE